MVFRNAPSVTTVNGKSVLPQKRYGKHIQIAPEQIELRANALNAIEAVKAHDDLEPVAQSSVFASRGAIADMDVFERQRIVHDQGGFVDQWLGQLAVIAKESRYLDDQLADPRWHDHPARPDALKRRDEFEEQIADIADSIAWAEAWADRCWQTLTEEERKPVAMMWLTSPETDRLVGRSWHDQAHYGWTWPDGFRVEGKWFNELPAELYTELTHLWQHTVTWLGSPVEIDTAGTERQNDELVAEIRARLS